MPVLTFKRHMTFIDPNRSQTATALVGVTSLVAVAAVDIVVVVVVVFGLSVSVITYDIA